jgi:hypothetical protein
MPEFYRADLREIPMAYRVLAAAHFLVAISLLPASVILGFLAAPALVLAPIWLTFVGVQLWRKNSERVSLVRGTHLVFLAIAALLCFYGVSGLRAAERSAAHGGGLLGGFGLIPLGIGIVLAALSLATLAVVRPE